MPTAKCPMCGSNEGFALWMHTYCEAYGETFTDEGLQCNRCGSIFREHDLNWETENA